MDKQQRLALFITLILLTPAMTACTKPDERISASDGSEVIPITLNDTGVTVYLEDITYDITSQTKTAPVLTSTAPAGLPGQDAAFGRDAVNLFNDSDGKAGFQFLKLDENGNALLNTATEWRCVFDVTTGLTWEVKTLDGLHDRDSRFTWYDSNAMTNGGFAGSIGNSTSCISNLTNCNTEELVKATNNEKLCGFTDWRLPTRDELRSLIDYGTVQSSGTAILDLNFFPYAHDGDHWTSQTAFYRDSTGTGGAYAWEVHFDTGYSEGHLKSASDVTARLVRGLQ